MAFDASYNRGPGIFRLVLGAALGAYDLVQTALGWGGIYKNGTAASSGETVTLTTDSGFTVTKTTGVVLLAGDKGYWDRSAGALHYKPVNDRDYFAGVVAADAASADDEAEIIQGVEPQYLIDLHRDAFTSDLVGTPAAGGFGYPVRLGGSYILELTATNEAQKQDLISTDGFSPDANPIVEFDFRVLSDGSGTTPDFNIGISNGTHASDFDSVTEFVGIHLDGNNVNINAQSRDGTTTVPSTDTLLDYTEGATFSSRVYGKIDCRDPSDVQIYINGALVLGATVFKINAAAGPLRLVAHLEKTATTDTYKIAIDRLRVRTSEQ